MYNIKQISIYCLLSFLLSLIITTFYVKKLNKQYYFVFILLFIVFYLFFYLMNLENKEDFNNFNYYAAGGYDKLHESNNVRTNNVRTNNVENNSKHNLLQEEEEHNNNLIKEEHHNIPQEEENHSNPIPQEEEQQKTYEKKMNNIVDLEKLSIKNSVKGNTCSPVNINIYNGEVENPDNKKDVNCKKSKNLGDYKSRVYNNSDWIYGNNAWTDTPDFYIPTPNDLLPTYNNNVQNISQKQNEVLLKKKFSESKMVCPMMINTPWSEYKSGDKDPEGFNL
jgi:Ca2+/Na+ antiporter